MNVNLKSSLKFTVSFFVDIEDPKVHKMKIIEVLGYGVGFGYWPPVLALEEAFGVLGFVISVASI